MRNKKKKHVILFLAFTEQAKHFDVKIVISV